MNEEPNPTEWRVPFRLPKPEGYMVRRFEWTPEAEVELPEVSPGVLIFRLEGFPNEETQTKVAEKAGLYLKEYPVLDHFIQRLKLTVIKEHDPSEVTLDQLFDRVLAIYERVMVVPTPSASFYDKVGPFTRELLDKISEPEKPES